MPGKFRVRPLADGKVRAAFHKRIGKGRLMADADRSRKGRSPYRKTGKTTLPAGGAHVSSARVLPEKGPASWLHTTRQDGHAWPRAESGSASRTDGTNCKRTDEGASQRAWRREDFRPDASDWSLVTSRQVGKAARRPVFTIAHQTLENLHLTTVSSILTRLPGSGF